MRSKKKKVWGYRWQTHHIKILSYVGMGKRKSQSGWDMGKNTRDILSKKTCEFIREDVSKNQRRGEGGTNLKGTEQVFFGGETKGEGSTPDITI